MEKQDLQQLIRFNQQMIEELNEDLKELKSIYELKESEILKRLINLKSYQMELRKKLDNLEKIIRYEG